MRNSEACVARNARVRWFVMLVALVGLAMLPNLATGQVAGEVMKVEEDWELVLNEPATDITSPQVTCLISPLSNADSVYGSLELNHGSLPDFTSGGLQLQAWSGESWLTLRDYADTTLQNNNETVTWTMKMWLNGGQLTFRVANGSSTSWGSFGDNGLFKLSINSALPNLNLYNPDVSRANSGISFGSQRVESLVLKKVRYYDAWNNLLFEDTAQRIVHQQ